MRSCLRAALAAVLVAACGSEAPRSSAAQVSKLRKDASGIDACALVKAEEIEAAAGWKPEAAKPDKHGRTATCSYHRAAEVKSIALVVSPGMRVLESSAAVAKWRSESVARHPELKIVVEPDERLGVPAVSRSPSLEVSKALAAKAIARLP